MSREDIAQAIKYTARQIEALEADDYAALPTMAVVRGMARSYARHLGIDADAVVAQLRQGEGGGAPTVNVPTIAVPFPTKIASSHRWIWILLGLILAGIAALLIEQLLGARERLAAAFSFATPATGAPALSSSVPTVMSDTSSPPEGTDAAGGAASSAGTVTTVVPAAPMSTAPGAKRIELEFQRDSWVEVRGADGQLLHNRLNPAGSRVTIDDRPPFKVIIGAATGVRLIFDGKSIDLAPNTLVGGVARLTLEK